jgi:TldD protein
MSIKFVKGYLLLLDLAAMTVDLALKHRVEYAEVRVERTDSTNIRMVRDRLEYIISGVDRGLGVRVLHKGAWGFASTSSFKREDIEDAIKSAVKAANATSFMLEKKVRLASVKACEDHVITPVKIPLPTVETKEKMKIVTRTSEIVRDYSPKIVSVTAVYGDSSGKRVIMTSDGAKILMERSLATVAVLAIAQEGEKITSIRERLGSPGGFEIFERLKFEETAKEVAERAVNLLKAKPAPTGRFTVVIDPKLAGVFAHEAVGHACEGDHVADGESILQGKIGEKVGSEHVTIYDDSTYPNGWGSTKYDMEGVPTKKRLLIHRGFLKDFILNRETAAELNMIHNGGARAQSYAFRPIVRMSNTYIAPGDYTFDELLEDVKNGIYVKGTRGGQVDPAKGTFQFSAEEAYLIEHGEITTPLLDVSLSGLTLETLNNIDAVAKDFGIHVGFCGKEDQIVPAGDGSPHIRIRNAVVGGRT